MDKQQWIEERKDIEEFIFKKTGMSLEELYDCINNGKTAVCGTQIQE